VSDPELKDADGVAEQFGVSRRIVYHWVNENGCPAIRLGRALWFRPQSVLEWLEGNAVNGTEQSGP